MIIGDGHRVSGLFSRLPLLGRFQRSGPRKQFWQEIHVEFFLPHRDEGRGVHSQDKGKSQRQHRYWSLCAPKPHLRRQTHRARQQTC